MLIKVLPRGCTCVHVRMHGRPALLDQSILSFSSGGFTPPTLSIALALFTSLRLSLPLVASLVVLTQPRCTTTPISPSNNIPHATSVSAWPAASMTLSPTLMTSTFLAATLAFERDDVIRRAHVSRKRKQQTTSPRGR